jgi:hypothetical protein
VPSRSRSSAGSVHSRAAQAALFLCWLGGGGFGFPPGPGLDSALCGFGGMLSMRAIIRLASSRSLSSAMKSPEKMPLLHLGIPLSPDDYKQVGQITAMFGYIEL